MTRLTSRSKKPVSAPALIDAYPAAKKLVKFQTSLLCKRLKRGPVHISLRCNK